MCNITSFDVRTQVLKQWTTHWTSCAAAWNQHFTLLLALNGQLQASQLDPDWPQFIHLIDGVEMLP